MSEPENFLARWARLKRQTVEAEAADAPAPPDAATPDAATSEARADAPATEGPPAGEPVFDITKLPPIDSITATTDIRAFLAPGVPPELTRAALRRAWVADPAIRDFIGIAENQWDFTAPDGVPGFGPLGPLDDVRRLVAQVFDGSCDDEARSDERGEEEEKLADQTDSALNPPQVTATSGEAPAPPDAHETIMPSPGVQCSNPDSTAPITRSEDDAEVRPEVSTRRPHGGALPQ